MLHYARLAISSSHTPVILLKTIAPDPSLSLLPPEINPPQKVRPDKKNII